MRRHTAPPRRKIAARTDDFLRELPTFAQILVPTSRSTDASPLDVIAKAGALDASSAETCERTPTWRDRRLELFLDARTVKA